MPAERTVSIDYFRSGRAALGLWIGVLGGPVAWFANQQINLLLVSWACSSGSLIVLHLISLACLAAALVSGWIACRNCQRVHATEPDDGETTFSRARFLSRLGLLLSALFTVVIIAQDLPNFILDPCHR